MVNTLNIPEVSVDEMIHELTRIYSAALRSHTAFARVPSVFLWGPPGTGKSQAVRQIAAHLEMDCHVTVRLTDVRLLLFSPIDLRGVPVADVKHEFTDWLKPRIFEMPPDESVVNLLFLDELSSAPQSVQAAAYQICLDRRIGEHLLPPNCIVIAAGNRTTDQSVSYRMPKALCNRMMHFSVCPNYSSWRRWALTGGIDSRIISYLGFDNSRLCVEPGTSDLAYPTPRSWEFVSTLLQTVDQEPQRIHHLIAACVGNDAAYEFETYCTGVLYTPPVEDILAGRCTQIPQTHDVLYALLTSLVSYISRNRDALGVNELDHVLAYVQRLPADFIAAFMQDLSGIEGLKGKLVRSRIFQEWASKEGAAQ